jgi:hypothetical protein
MARFRPTAFMERWKKHLCIGCGCAFRHFLARTTGERRGAGRVMLRPCPVCGLYQPDMVGTRRLWLHLVIALASCALLTLFGGLIETHTFPTPVMIGLAAAFGLLPLMGHLGVVAWNPNRNPEANRARAKRLLRSGNMELLTVATPELAAERLPRFGLTALPVLGAALLALGLAAIPGAELVRLACGWPVNPDWGPAVVAPGDEACYYFPERITSIKGLWRGTARVEVLNPEELGLADTWLLASTENKSWGGTIYTETSEQRNSTHPWVAVQLPNSPQMAGKRVQVRIDLTAVYPVIDGPQYHNKQEVFTGLASVELADTPRAGRFYMALCRLGTFGGAAWVGFTSLFFFWGAWALRREARPAKTLLLREEDDEDDEDDDLPKWPRRR